MVIAPLRERVGIGQDPRFSREKVAQKEGLPQSGKEMIFYQIYPSTFADSNKDGIGDIGGIISHLDYVQSLGVNMLWISPIYPSPQKDGGYDVADYKNIDPRFGTLADFDRLVAGAKKRGMGIVIDFVGSHTSDQHEWFQKAIDPTNPEHTRYQQYYHFADPQPDGSPPNNWQSIFGGPAWRWVPEVHKYVFHKFDPSQPDLNLRNREVIEEEKKILEFWLDKGVAGFRFDAFDHMLEDPTFSDMLQNPSYESTNRKIEQWQWQDRYTSYEELYPIAKEFADVVHSKNGVFVAETFTAKPKELGELVKKGVDLPFNFTLVDAPFTPEGLKKSIDEYMGMFARLPDSAVPNFFLGNHDRERLASRIGKEKMPLAQLLLLTLPGAPFLYNGDEIGMMNATIPPHRHRDPQAFRDSIDHSRDVARSPIPWRRGRKNAGFSKADGEDLWLPLGEVGKGLTIRDQERDPRSLLSLTKQLIHIRMHAPTLRYGSYIPMESGNPDIFCFGRQYQDKTMMTVMNISGNSQAFSLAPNVMGNVILTTTGRKVKIQEGKIQLYPYEGCIITSDMSEGKIRR